MTSRGLLLFVLLAWPIAGWAHGTGSDERLPLLGPAPDFTLTSQDGAQLSLSDLRGKVVVVAFIYTSCKDTCPFLTAKMAQVQDKLGKDFGSRIAFLSITVDPERDTPEVLSQYAQNMGANLAGWAFLTGTPGAIKEVTRQYGVAVSKAGEDVNHTLLTSLVDPNGNLRVQYIGVRFDPEEFRRDLLSLMGETE
jgi:protein SCO1/2